MSYSFLNIFPTASTTSGRVFHRSSSKSELNERLAEEEGFEPPDPCGSTVFKTAAIDHSATPPRRDSSTTRSLRS